MIDFLVILGVVWLLFAIVQDLRKREIANWLNFSLIIFAMIYRLLYSIFSNDYGFILAGLFGLIIFFVIANLFYYLRLFAGGDAKLMIALGVLIPFTESFYSNLLIFFIFIIALLLGGVVYSLAYSGGLAIKNAKAFSKEFKKEFARKTKFVYLGLGAGFAVIILSIITSQIAFIILGILLILLPFVYFYTKAIEKSCMMAYVDPKKLTIGDWIVEEIKIPRTKKIIKPYWEGLSEEDLNLIKKYYKKKVLVKQGIPFSPSFLIAFIVLVYILYLGKGDWNYPFGF